MLARLIAYVGALALLTIAGVHLWDRLPDIVDLEPPAQAGWSAAWRARPAFAVSQFDSSDKTEAYKVLQHPEGGRREVFRWAARDGKQGRPVAELEIYRPGAESSQSGSIMAEIAARMDPEGRRELEAAGVIDSKFGNVALFRLAGSASDARSCLGFVKHFDEPNRQISGWSCQGEALPARRAEISCVLSRLILLTAGNDPKLGELFARTQLKRVSCAAAPPALSADWVTAAENPLLRGTL